MMKEFAMRGRKLLEELEQELKKEPKYRTTHSSSEDLELVMKIIGEMINAIETNKLPSREDRWPRLARIITDTWSFPCKLSNDLIQYERKYRGI